MPILNYTTQIDAEKTATQIQKMLVSAGAEAVLCEYGGRGTTTPVMSSISFRMATQYGPIFFRLPANIAGVHKALQNEGVRPKLQTEEQAARVAWRIVKDWVEAQVAIIEAGMAESTEVFLPYAQDNTGETLYERMKANQFKALTHQEPTHD